MPPGPNRSGQFLLSSSRDAVLPGDTLRIRGNLSIPGGDSFDPASSAVWSCSDGQLVEVERGDSWEADWISPEVEGEYWVSINDPARPNITGDTLHIWVLEHARPYAVMVVSNNSYTSEYLSRYYLKIYGSPPPRMEELFIGGQFVDMRRHNEYYQPGIYTYSISQEPLQAGDPVEVEFVTEVGTVGGSCMFPDSLDGMTHSLTRDDVTGEHTLRVNFPQERADQMEISLSYRYYVDGVSYSDHLTMLIDTPQWVFSFSELPLGTYRVTVYISPANGVYSDGTGQHNLSGDFNGRLLAYGPRTLLQYNIAANSQGKVLLAEEQEILP